MTRTDWNLAQLDDYQIDFCKSEARKLAAMGILDEDGNKISYSDWLDHVAESVRIENDHHRGAFCTEMGEQ